MSRAAPRPWWLRAGPPTAQRVVLRAKKELRTAGPRRGPFPLLQYRSSFFPPFFIVVKHNTEHLHHFRVCSAVALSALTALCYPPLALFQDLPISPLSSSRPAGLLSTLCLNLVTRVGGITQSMAFVSGSFHWAQCLQGSSILCPVSEFPSV